MVLTKEFTPSSALLCYIVSSFFLFRVHILSWVLGLVFASIALRLKLGLETRVVNYST